MQLAVSNGAIPSVIESLRSATRSRHARMECIPAMARLFSPDYTRDEYRAHLSRLLGFFEPLEQAAEQASVRAENHADPLPKLERCGDLRRDLLAMGVTAAEIDALYRCPRVPSISASGLRGYVYVMLGSTLGGGVIVERLRPVLGDGASYEFYGDGRGLFQAHWAAFRRGLRNTAGRICGPSAPPRLRYSMPTQRGCRSRL